MKPWLILCCLFLGIYTAKGQDSGEETAQIPALALVDESEGLRRSGQMDAAIQKALEAEEIVLLGDADSTQYLVYRQLVRLHILSSSFSKAQSYLDNAHEIASSLDSLAYIAEVNYFNGFIYNKLGNLDESLRYYDLALKQHAEVRDTTTMIKIYVNMGRIYGEQKNYDTSIEVSKKALALAEARKDSLNMSIALQNQGAAYKFLQEWDLALDVLNQSLALNIAPRTQYKNVFPLVNIASIYKEKGDTVQYRQTLWKAYRIAGEFGRLDILAVTERNMVEYYSFINKLDSALIFAEESWYHANLDQDSRTYGAIMAVLCEVNEKLGRYQEALCWMKSWKEYELTLLSLEKTEYGEELRVRFDVEKKDAQNQILLEGQKELKRQQRWTYVVSGIVVLLLIIIVFILARSNRRASRFTESLSAKNAEIEQSNAQLIELNADKDALMSIVAHDLKAPLSKIAGLLDVMEMVRNDPDQFEKTSRMMASVVTSGENLINELVLMSSLEKSLVVSDLQEVDMSQLLAECAASFRPAGEKKNIEVTLRPPTESTVLTTSHKYLLRVLDNLMSNAIKFSPRERQVILSGERNGSHFLIDIIDQGPGIPKEDQGRLFQKFVRLKNRPTAGESSTGLGLSIVKELVDQLGGQIEVMSEVGQGSTFRVLLPLDQN